MRALLLPGVQHQLVQGFRAVLQHNTARATREDFGRCGHKAPIYKSGTVVRLTDSDVTIGQCVVSDRNLVCAFLIRYKTLSDGEAEVCLLPY